MYDAEWLHLCNSGRLHGNISMGTLFALDDSDEEGENDLGNRQTVQRMDELYKFMREASQRNESELKNIVNKAKERRRIKQSCNDNEIDIVPVD